MIDVPSQFKHMVGCTRCPLSKTRTNVVVGRGNLRRCKYVMIGEAPGQHEDEEGLPFVGAAGRKLEELVAEAGLDTNDFYITNIIMCRPPGNRKPTSDEIKACSIHMTLKMSIFGSKTIMTVGGTALQYFMPELKIMSVHGQFLTSKRGKIIFPLIHPAAALRRRDWEPLILADLKTFAGGDSRQTTQGIFTARVIGR